jgi:hypothetical protein
MADEKYGAIQTYSGPSRQLVELSRGKHAKRARKEDPVHGRSLTFGTWDHLI